MELWVDAVGLAEITVPPRVQVVYFLGESCQSPLFLPLSWMQLVN